jgi:oligoendopeptidase F
MTPGTWDLENQYPNPAAWDADRRRLQAMIATLPRLKGSAGKSPAQLANVLDRAREARSLAGKMARFALLVNELDTTSDATAAQFAAARASEADVEAALSWLGGDVASIGANRVLRWIASEPRLIRHRRRIHRIFAEREHAGPAAQQELLARMIRWPNALADAADALTASDLGWTNVIGPSGEVLKADYGSYARNRRSPDKRLRDAVGAAVLARLRGAEDAFGILLTRRIEGENAIARARGFDNSLDASFMLNDRVPGTAWRAMIAASRAHRATLLRIGGVLRRVHRLDRFDFGDFYARYSAPPLTIPIDDARDTIIRALAPMGETYQRDLRARLAQPWGHYLPLPNKSSSVGVYWQVGGGHPYTVLNYNNDLAGAQVLAHSAMPMMWYADIPDEVSPDRREEDPAVHGNALWYASRLLFDDQLLSTTSDREQRIALLRDQLFLLWRNYALLAITAELEQRIVESKEPLTGSQISAAYLELIRSYFQNPADAVTIDGAYAAHWMTNDQMFYSHTQVVFPVALAAGAYWVERIAARDPRAVAGVRRTMTANGSQYSHDLLLDAGIDVTRRDLYDAMFRRIDQLLDRLDQEVAGRRPGTADQSASRLRLMPSAGAGHDPPSASVAWAAFRRPR